MESAADALSKNNDAHRRCARMRPRNGAVRFGGGLFLVFAVVTLSVGAMAQQQVTPPSGAAGAITPAPATAPAVDNHTAVIRGRVLRADTGRPLSSARVAATRAGSGSEIATSISDESGRFELRGLKAGRYTVQATRTGYVTFSYGQRRSSEAGRAIEVGIAQTVNGIELSLPRGAVITGTVVDEYGEPLVGAPVEVMRPRFVNGVRRMLSIGGALTGADLTDDRGHFRLHGLEAGTYYVAAGPSSAPPDRAFRSAEGLANFYPGTTSVVEAQAIQLVAGQELSGISFTVRPVRLAAIRGTIHRSDGTPGRSVLASDEYGDGGRDARADKDGSFVLPDLPPGRYQLFAVEDGEVVVTSVVLDGSDLVVPLVMSKVPTIRGQIRFEGDAGRSRPRPSDVLIGVRAIASGAISRATIGNDGTFSITALPVAQWLVASAGEWNLLAIRSNGEDVTAQASFEPGELSDLEIILSTRRTTLTGVVHDSRGRATPDATVVLFPEKSNASEAELRRFVRVVRPDDQGRFTVQGVWPFRYRAVAVEDLERGEETNPEMLQRLARRGVAVTITAGQTHAVNLRVEDVP